MTNILPYNFKAAALFLLLGVCTMPLSGCQREVLPVADYVVTLPPLKMILEPLVEGRKTVACLLPPGISPHTYSLGPAGARQLNGADTVFYVDEALDGWAAHLGTRPACSLLALVPEEHRLPYASGVALEDENGGGVPMLLGTNPHFWSDPQVVAAMVPALVDFLTARDPEGKSQYEANATVFLKALKKLDADLAESMATIPPVSLVAFHPSWAYFFKRYGLTVAAYVEPVPGKELTPRSLAELHEKLASAGRVVVLSEPQLPRKSADALAEMLSAPVVVVDPLGGKPPLLHYADLLRVNAEHLREALR